MKRIKIFTKRIFLIFTILLLFGCTVKSHDDYIVKIESWQKKRVKKLIRDDGWLSLVGLFPLKEGVNTFGSAKQNDLRFPEKAPAFLGKFILEKESVRLKAHSEAGIIINDSLVESSMLENDLSGKPTIMRYKSLSWYVIKRGEDFLIRLKDSENPDIKNFKGIDTYAVDAKWRVKARLEPYNPPKTIPVLTALGNMLDEPYPGALVFEINGKSYHLDPIAAETDKKYFIIFSDETSGRTTYGAGRFLAVDKVDEKGETFIDFNKAYNPPCAFNDFATCPLPPKQNHIPVKITAGEKDYGLH